MVWLAGCQTGSAEYYRSACAKAGHAPDSAQFDACVADRVAELARWNRTNYHYGGGGGP